MADPITLTAISMAGSAGGGLLGAFGAMQKGSAEAGMYTYQSGVAQINKQIALQNADYSIQAGEVRAQESGMQTRAQIGEIKTVQSGKGLDVNSGSALTVRESESAIGAENTGVIRADAARKAYGYNVEAAGYEATSQMDLQAASQSKKAGIMGALGSILGGAASVSSKWMQAGQAGITSSTGGSNPPGSYYPA